MTQATIFLVNLPNIYKCVQFFSVLNIYDCGIVLTYLSDADRNNAQTFAFIAVVTLADNQLIKLIWLALPGCI